MRILVDLRGAGALGSGSSTAGKLLPVLCKLGDSASEVACA
jgi:hypothetical protein